MRRSTTNSQINVLAKQHAALRIQDDLIVGDIKLLILLQSHAHSLENRLAVKQKIPAKFQHVIDWVSFEIAIKKKNPTERV